MFDLWGYWLQGKDNQGDKARKDEDKGKPLLATVPLSVACAVFPTGGGYDWIVHFVFLISGYGRAG